MNGILSDFRFGVRMLAKKPGATVICVGALALGIGLSAMMFSITYGALWRGLPFEESHRILHMERTNPEQGITSMEVTVHDYFDWQEQQSTFEDIAAFYTGTVNISGTERAERYDGAFITANAFRLLRVTAALGRTFRDDEDTLAAEPVIILGHRVWTDRYESDPDILGRAVRVNGREAMVIGVMPEGFSFPILQDVWVPLRFNPEIDPLALERGEGMTLEVFGRLADGRTRDDAGAEYAAITQRLGLEYPETNEGVGVIMKPYVEEFIGDEAPLLLFTMLGAVFFVLAIACANVANLLLSRAFDRGREVAIRSALGAKRFRVIRQLLIEVFLLALVGAGLGIVLAQIGIAQFNRALEASTDVPFFIVIQMDWPVMAFVLGATLLATLLSGVLPAFQSTGANLSQTLSDETRGSSSLRLGRISKVLVVGQIALSCGLLVGAGLMSKSILNLGTADFGYDPDTVMTARVGLFETSFPDRESRIEFYEELQRRLAARPGVEAVSITTALPASGFAGGNLFMIEGESYSARTDYPRTNYSIASPGFFNTFTTEFLRGRDFNALDREGSLPAVVVNQSFVDRFFATADPIGARIRMGMDDSEEPWLTIVGVVPDLVNNTQQEEHQAAYVPLAQQDANFASIAVRTAGNPLSFAAVIRDEVSGLDRDLPVYWLRTMADVIHEQTWFVLVFGALFMIMGFVALFLAAVGLYGVMSFSVSRRTHEVGIRLALGAGSRDVLSMIVRQGAKQIAIGVVLGLALAWGVSRLLENFLYEVEPRDPVTFIVITTVLVLAGLAASFVPALRASRVDPNVALRTM